MGLFDIFKSTKVADVVNVDKKKPAGSDLITRVTQSQLVRSSQDVKKWRDALSAAESTTKPQRIDLIRIYKELTLDAHLSSVMQQRTNKVLARAFKITDSNGDTDEEKTALLSSAWFERFMRFALDAKYYGFSLVEFGSLTNDAFDSVEVVPRQYVVPEFGVVNTKLSGGATIDYTRPPYSNWALFVGETKDFGLLNKAAPIVLWKRLVQATWAEYNELYGVPLRIGRTNTRDPQARNNLEDMLENLGSSAWGLFDEEDKIEIINGVKVGGQGTFKDFIKLADEQISKLFVGQTMTTEDGASLSQSQVHENTLASFTGADLRWLAHVVNNQLLPFITMKGLSFEGDTFAFDLDETLSLADQFAIDKELLNHYKIPADYIAATYGTPVEEVVAAPSEPTNGVTIMNDVGDLYKDFFKHGEACSCGNC